MDKKEATLTLAKESRKKLGYKTVMEAEYKNILIKNASQVYPIANPITFWYEKGEVSDYLEEEALTGANYIFLEKILTEETRSRFAATPYAIIGEEEKKDLKRLFYKDVSPDVKSAMALLGIKNFIEVYQCYINSGVSSFEKALQDVEDVKFMKEFVDFCSSLEYNNCGGVHKKKFECFGGLKAINSRFRKTNLQARISTKKGRSPLCMTFCPGDVHKNNLTKIIAELKEKIYPLEQPFEADILNDFYNFVFSIPYDDQNIDVNKAILKSSQDSLDYVRILEREYSQGRYFQDYLNCLDSQNRNCVLGKIKDWSTDHLRLYKEDTQGFINYFSAKELKEKKIILRSVMDSDFINEAVIDWLNEHETDLVREVGLNG
ncbi:MAG: hypothetical protein Q8N77_03290 [Nanoarchaeota archaeon]|nr:hypothetical protein [Nanoarchaeota archaeon]